MTILPIYLLKGNNRNPRTSCEICSKLTIKTPEQRYWRCSGVIIVNFEHISQLVLVSLLLTLIIFIIAGRGGFEFNILTHFTLIFVFCFPWRCQETSSFLTFLGGIRMDH